MKPHPCVRAPHALAADESGIPARRSEARRCACGLGLVGLSLGMPACADPAPGEGRESGAQSDSDCSSSSSEPLLTRTQSALPEAQPEAARARRIAYAEQIPGLARQSTARGRSISALQAHADGIYLGYGDYRQNTGPIDVVAYIPGPGPGLGHFRVENALTTEEIQHFRVWQGQLWVPDSDPRGDALSGSVFVKESDCGGWQPRPEFSGAVHVFDAAVYGDELLIATGSLTDAPAFVLATEDGYSWREATRLQPPAGHFARYEHIHIHEASIFVSASSYGSGTVQRGHQYFDGQRWSALRASPTTGMSFVVAASDTGAWLVEFAGDPGKQGQHIGSWTVDGETWTRSRRLPLDHHLINWQLHPGSTGSPELWAISVDSHGQSWIWAQSASPPTANPWQLRLALDPQLVGEHPTAITRVGDELYLGTSTGALLVVEGLWPSRSDLESQK